MPRTCQWPNHVDAYPTGADLIPDDTPRCGTRVPSFVATTQTTFGPVDLDVCDVHKPAAEAAGYTLDRADDAMRSLADEARSDTDDLARTMADSARNMADLLDPTPDPVDHELTALANIADEMRTLPDDDTRRRVAAWVADRYGAPI